MISSHTVNFLNSHSQSSSDNRWSDSLKVISDISAIGLQELSEVSTDVLFSIGAESAEINSCLSCGFIRFFKNDEHILDMGGRAEAGVSIN